MKKLPLLAALALAACGANTSAVAVHVVTAGCAGAPDAFAGADTIQVQASTLLAQGDPGYFDPITTSQPLSAGKVSMPNIPVGKQRLLTVSATKGGQLVGYGGSDPFDMTDKPGGSVSVTVIVRPATQFVGAPLASGKCAAMRTARAGHTATLMHDGRVFIAGGFKENKNLRDPSCTPDAFFTCRDYLASAEIFDPNSGAFSPAKDMNYPRAYHTATAIWLPGHQQQVVMVAGGEQTTTDAGGQTTVRSIREVDVYDPSIDDYGFYGMVVGRSHHTATLVTDSNGNERVFFAGGIMNYYSASGPASPEARSDTEWFDPLIVPTATTDQFVASDNMEAWVGGQVAETKRYDHAAVSIGGGVVIVGGTDSQTVWNSFVVYRWNPQSSKFELFNDPSVMNDTLKLADARFGLMAVLDPSNPRDMIVAGGWTSIDKTEMSDKVEVADFSTFGAPTLATTAPGARADGCMLSIPGTNQVLLLGGAGPAGSLASAWDLKSTNGSIAPSEVAPSGKALATARSDAACTPLLDGSILVTGGIVDDGTNAATTASAEIYTPRF